MTKPDEPDFDSDKLRDDEALVARSFWDKLRKTLGLIPFMEDALAAYYCATDKATPLYVRAMLMGALAYFIIPSDVIPDFIVGLGFTDDASILAAAIAAVHTTMKPKHFEAARDFLDKQSPAAADEEK